MDMNVLQAESTQLQQDLLSARAESDRLFDILRPDALYERPIDARHRVIFYVGHLEGFDSIQICREALGIPSSEPEMDALFQAGIDPDASSLPTDQPSDWPSLEQVRAYAHRARQLVDTHLEHAPEDIVTMAVEHRQMHLETLAYMFHNFPYSMKSQPGPLSIPAVASLLQNEWNDIPAGEAVLGKPHDGSFGWDNEYNETRRYVPAFRMQRYNVTNGEYLKFVQDGAAMPKFWSRHDEGFFVRGMFSEFPMPLDWPVYVTQQEAAAYATWIGASLPSEEQFHRAAYGNLAGQPRHYPWGNHSPRPTLGNFDFNAWDLEPVTANPQGDSAFGVRQLVGNGWEWTQTPFGPLPGFEPYSTYPGYSANFFDNEHFVLKGGSPRTAARLLRSSFRNWFRKDYPYMYATFRCVEN